MRMSSDIGSITEADRLSVGVGGVEGVVPGGVEDVVSGGVEGVVPGGVEGVGAFIVAVVGSVIVVVVVGTGFEGSTLYVVVGFC